MSRHSAQLFDAFCERCRDAVLVLLHPALDAGVISKRENVDVAPVSDRSAANQHICPFNETSVKFVTSVMHFLLSLWICVTLVSVLIF